ncbi:hypothetical protein ACFLZZ_02165 [Nanoarchaeota archaeon]
MKKQKVFIFIGVAGSGKTELVKEFAKRKKLKFYDILDIMLSYIKKYGSVTEKDKSILKEVMGKYLKSFSKKKFDILEFALGSFLPKVVKALGDREVIVIYCNAPLKLCKERNKKRKRNVPEHYLKYQAQFKGPFYNKLKKSLDFELITIDMRQSPAVCLKELLIKVSNK